MFTGFIEKYKSHYKETLLLASPIVVSQLGHTFVHLADSIIVGHFAGTTELAAVSLVNSIFMMILVIGLGISNGLTPLIAKENGAKNYKECGRLLSNSLIMNIGVSILLFIFVYFGTLVIIDHIGQDPEVVRYAKPYLMLLGISIIPLMIFQTFKQFTEGLGFTFQAMMVSIWGNLINIVLGVILVKGMFGFEPMGVKGVGYSTLIDRTIMAIAMTAYVLRSKHFKKYLENFKMLYINKEKIKTIFKIGAPISMQYAFEISAFSGAAILAGTISPATQAAHQITISLAAMTYMMASGVASAATIKSGSNLGSKSFLNLRRSAISSYHIVLVLMSITGIAFILFNEKLPYIFTTDKEVITIAVQLFIIAGFFQLFDGTQVVGLGVLRGLGDVNIPTVITFLAYWVIGIPLGYFLGIYLGIGINGIWYGLTFALLTSSVLLFFRFQFRTRELIKKFKINENELT